MSDEHKFKEIAPPAADPVRAGVIEPPAESEEDPMPEEVKELQSAKISFESDMSREEAVSYLDAVVKGLATGTVTFRQGDECLDMQPSRNVGVEVKATRKGRKEKISFELFWRRPPENDLLID